MFTKTPLYFSKIQLPVVVRCGERDLQHGYSQRQPRSRQVYSGKLEHPTFPPRRNDAYKNAPASASLLDVTPLTHHGTREFESPASMVSIIVVHCKTRVSNLKRQRGAPSRGSAGGGGRGAIAEYGMTTIP
jgi:hypothetical protein